jgi:hypothetical protein
MGVEEGDAPIHSGGFGRAEPHHSHAQFGFSSKYGLGNIYAKPPKIIACGAVL